MPSEHTCCSIHQLRHWLSLNTSTVMLMPVQLLLLALIKIPCLGEWENACNELQRMLVVRSLRADRVSFCATSFIVSNLGSK